MERFVADCVSPHPSRGALCVERQSAPQAFLQYGRRLRDVETCTSTRSLADADSRTASVRAA